jgi:hypothetical protein
VPVSKLQINDATRIRWQTEQAVMPWRHIVLLRCSRYSDFAREFNNAPDWLVAPLRTYLKRRAVHYLQLVKAFFGRLLLLLRVHISRRPLRALAQPVLKFHEGACDVPFTGQ